MRLIDADVVLQELGCDNCHFYGTDECKSIAVCRGRHKVMYAPTIDPVKHGRWMVDTLFISNVEYWAFNCSVCHTGSDEDYEYCPCCGARMDGAAE